MQINAFTLTTKDFLSLKCLDADEMRGSTGKSLLKRKLLWDDAGERSCKTFCSRGSTTNKVEKNAAEIFFLDQVRAAKWPATIFCVNIVDITNDEHKGKGAL